MFEQEIEKKSKITPGLLIVFGIFFMSIIVIINDNMVIDNLNDNIKYISEDK